MATEKIYVGKGKSQFDNLVRVSICLTDIQNEAGEFISEYNGKQYISLDVVTRREVDQYGNSHYITVNTYKGNGESKAPATESKEDLPF